MHRLGIKENSKAESSCIIPPLIHINIDSLYINLHNTWIPSNLTTLLGLVNCQNLSTALT